MSKPLVLRSPAKVNLFLKVINQREDGFHNICTIFERISLFDTIELSLLPSQKIKIECNHPHVPTGSKNLVHKVARLIQQNYGIQQGVKIKIIKRIPVAAGLAGGSSNAATVLEGLNQLWNVKLSQQKLLILAKQIGSDVAFFLYHCSWALGTERGDHIRPLAVKRKLSHVLVVPKIKMYAGEVYEALKLKNGPEAFLRSIESRRNIKVCEKNSGKNLKLTKKSDDVNILLHQLRKNNIIDVGRLMVNDLEVAVLHLEPALLKLKQKLKSLNAQGVMVSGSGPCVYGLTQDLKEAQMIRDQLLRRYRQTFAVETL
jgi:4-diphosphocytidyl-2-C-methyl-D-erythritol kinase